MLFVTYVLYLDDAYNNIARLYPPNEGHNSDSTFLTVGAVIRQLITPTSSHQANASPARRQETTKTKKDTKHTTTWWTFRWTPLKKCPATLFNRVFYIGHFSQGQHISMLSNVAAVLLFYTIYCGCLSVASSLLAPSRLDEYMNNVARKEQYSPFIVYWYLHAPICFISTYL